MAFLSSEELWSQEGVIHFGLRTRQITSSSICTILQMTLSLVHTQTRAYLKKSEKGKKNLAFCDALICEFKQWLMCDEKF